MTTRFTALTLFILLSSQLALAAPPITPSSPPVAKPAAKPAAPAPVAATGPNAITRAVTQQGVLSCASRIEQVSNYLGFNASAGALVFSPPAQPDQRLLPLSIELATPNGAAYASASFAPNQANGCGATYDAVVYWPQKCEQVSSRFNGMKRVGQLKKDIIVLDGGASSKVFLMPAGPGCISIKKEVVL